MQEFLTVVFGFPTLPYSVLLAVAALYWLLAGFGLVDDGFGDAGIDGALEGDAELHGLSAFLSRWGLGGVPVMVVLTLLVFLAWTLTYFVHLFVLLSLPSTLRWLIGVMTVVLAPLPAVPVAALVLRPLRQFLLRLRPLPAAALLGRTGVVASPKVNGSSGHATFDDGGAGLVLQVRSETELYRGDRVMLVEHVAAQHYYRVVRADAAAIGQPEPLFTGDKEMHR